MQNTSEQQPNETRVQDVGTTINLQPANNKGNFLIFLLAGFIVMTSIVFTGLYIDDVTAVILDKPKAPSPSTQITPSKAALDSLAAAMAVPDDKALEVRDQLVVWLKADALTKAKNNDSIQILPDASARHLNALQPAAASQPLYIANALNGKPVLRFDGVDDHYFLGSISDTTPASIFVVWQKLKAGGNQYQRLYSSSGSNIDYQSKGAAFIPPTENTGVGAAPARMDVLIDTVMDLRNFYIGRLNASPEQFYFGDLAEILVYTRVLSPKEQQSVAAYLKNKYGL